MSARRIRVLVVDDSAFTRKVLREVLSSSPELEVVGIARDGLEALEKVEELKPDVMTLDLVMPNLDGLGVLRALPLQNRPRVVAVSISDEDSALGVEALHSGALDVVQKPTALATERLYELRAELIAKVVAAAAARVPVRLDHTPPVPRDRTEPPVARRGTRLLVVGASTGGPQAITRLLQALPGDFPVPIAIALHIPAGYTEGLARRLDGQCALTVREAAQDMPLCAGTALLVPGGQNMRIGRQGSDLFARLSQETGHSLHIPSVDTLFSSAAIQTGAKALGLVLTGMGNDGLEGARDIHAAGGWVLTESESSCVVYGMPRSVWEAQLAHAQAPIEALADLLLDSI
jgi:two-component system chemotaxis response regulator CheB